MATYELTRAEARLTAGLVAGDELKTLALQFGVSYNTVRTQLRSVLGKLGLQRQNELLAKILSDPLVTLRTATDTPLTPAFNAIVLPDGRRLAWCEYGPADGYPVVVSHASLWSRLQRHPDAGALERHRIRLIVPDRPGYGRSDPQPGRGLLDWPGDVSVLMDHLGIERFSVVGIMLGGDYALAAAKAMPQRVAQVVLLGSRVSQVLCSDCPPGPRAVRVLERLSVTYPRLLTTALQSVFREMLRKPDTFVTKVLPVLGPKDQEIWEKGELQPLFLAAFREANRQGLAKAVVDDWAVLTAPWPFAPEDIAAPVTIWHGREDSLCPVEHIENLASRLPNCRLHIIEDGNSYVFMHQWEDALRCLSDGKDR
jgi:pimeloyl-ACP methyl ester carboxylesterase/DNA-binding CsgD family transcriptional regulator